MGYKVIFKKRFAKNLLSVLIFLEQEWGKKVADEFQDKINYAVRLLKFHPYLGASSQKRPGARGLLITKPNRLFYRIENQTIVILLLADTRKKNIPPLMSVSLEL